jgi:hypothetical protein
MTALAACGPSHGANFDYPNQPPVPTGASVVASTKGADDDDPMRGRQIVIDAGSAGPAEVVEFYRQEFPSASGWLPGTPDPDVGGGDLLRLVSHATQRFDEYVEIHPYVGATSEETHRYAVSISRLHVVTDQGKRTVDRCGLAGIWFPTDPQIGRTGARPGPFAS